MQDQRLRQTGLIIAGQRFGNALLVHVALKLIRLRVDLNIRNLHGFGRGFRRQQVRYALLDLGRRFWRKPAVKLRSFTRFRFPCFRLRRVLFLCLGFPHRAASRVAVRHVVGVFCRAFDGRFHGVFKAKAFCFNFGRKRALLLRHAAEINMPVAVLVIKGGHGCRVLPFKYHVVNVRVLQRVNIIFYRVNLHLIVQPGVGVSQIQVVGERAEIRVASRIPNRVNRYRYILIVDVFKRELLLLPFSFVQVLQVLFQVVQ